MSDFIFQKLRLNDDVLCVWKNKQVMGDEMDEVTGFLLGIFKICPRHVGTVKTTDIISNNNRYDYFFAIPNSAFSPNVEETINSSTDLFTWNSFDFQDIQIYPEKFLAAYPHSSMQQSRVKVEKYGVLIESKGKSPSDMLKSIENQLAQLLYKKNLDKCLGSQQNIDKSLVNTNIEIRVPRNILLSNHIFNMLQHAKRNGIEHLITSKKK